MRRLSLTGIGAVVAVIGIVGWNAVACGSDAGIAGVDVLTQRNDIARSGLNLRETTLTAQNVGGATFGKIFSRAVDDELYAQLLVVSGLEIPGRGVHNVVFAATVNNSIYAFDADDPSQAEPLWRVNYTPGSARPTKVSDLAGACGGSYRDLAGNIGILGTPVIERATYTMYFVTRTFENGRHVQRLHAVDIRDGGERPNSPVVISAGVAGKGAGGKDGVVSFDALKENQRAGLLLLNGVVYLAWGSHCDWWPYHGWILGYDAASLAQAVVWNVTPDGYGGGIWQSGQGLASDGTNIFAVSGNGTIGEHGDKSSTRNRADSIMKLVRTGGTLAVATWFTPYDWKRLNQHDLDLGSAGLLLLPGTHLGVTGGKGGTLYVVDTDRMGGLSDSGYTDDNVIQSFNLNEPSNLHGTPLYWDGPNGGRVFAWANEDYLKSFPVLLETYAIGSTVLDADHVQQSTIRAPTDNDPTISLSPGGFLSLSADGKKPGSAVIWASMPLSGNANQETRPGILRAIDAADVTRELWNNRADEARDSCGNFAKFAVPTVANGKVYLGSFSRRLCVYGLLR